MNDSQSKADKTNYVLASMESRSESSEAEWYLSDTLSIVKSILPSLSSVKYLVVAE